MIQIRITISEEMYSALDIAARKLGKRPASLARELFEQRMIDAGLLDELLNRLPDAGNNLSQRRSLARFRSEKHFQPEASESHA